MASTLYATHSQRTAWLKKYEHTSKPRGEALGRRCTHEPHLARELPKPHNPRKYYEFHEQNEHTTTECRELMKALHKLANKGQIDGASVPSQRTSSRGGVFHRDSSYHHWHICKGHYPVSLEGSAAGSAVGPNSQTREPCHGSHNSIRRSESLYFTSPHNDPPVVELKVASIIVCRILIDIRSSVDIITWDCLKKFKHLGREIIPLIARECYLVSIRPLVERSDQHGPAGPLSSDKKQRTALPPPVEALKLKIKSEGEKHKQAKTLLHHMSRSSSSLASGTSSLSGVVTSPSRGTTIFIEYGRYKVYQLRIFAIGTSLAAVFDVLNVRLEVALLVKIIRGQGLQELPKEVCTVLMTASVALLLGLGRLFIPNNASPNEACTRPLTPPNFVASSGGPQSAPVVGHWNSGGREFASLRRRRTALTSQPSTPGHMPGKRHDMVSQRKKNGKKKMSRGRHNFTLAMATCSSVALGGSEEPEGAKFHNLARHSTRANLAGRSTPKKSMA
ncbi:hypothetical protein Cgig2_019225 [Carnegiea gigantea]|uniref:Uncharacterized protein n=1 Tax=Carnegiea gigantea TaxID=171969 RepID=A0A9Q1JVY1_9CARY|nr:hypothetical protein Cgig2_019225 [Carnegiea gigantea]